jgi:hypothetical protein
MPLMISLKIVEKEIDGNARTRRSQEQSQTVQNACDNNILVPSLSKILPAMISSHTIPPTSYMNF